MKAIWIVYSKGIVFQGEREGLFMEWTYNGDGFGAVKDLDQFDWLVFEALSKAEGETK